MYGFGARVVSTPLIVYGRSGTSYRRVRPGRLLVSVPKSLPHGWVAFSRQKYRRYRHDRFWGLTHRRLVGGKRGRGRFWAPFRSKPPPGSEQIACEISFDWELSKLLRPTCTSGILFKSNLVGPQPLPRSNSIFCPPNHLPSLIHLHSELAEGSHHGDLQLLLIQRLLWQPKIFYGLVLEPRCVLIKFLLRLFN